VRGSVHSEIDTAVSVETPESNPSTIPTTLDPRVENTLQDLGGIEYTNVLRELHKALRPKSYLEIGTLTGGTLKIAQCPSIAIDPVFRVEQDVLGGKHVCGFYQMTSDEFFADYNPEIILGRRIEFAFLDGLHFAEVLLRDFANTERHCNPKSIIALHDCVPVETAMAERVSGLSPIEPHRAGWWTGDVWRTVLALKRFRPDLNITALDAAPTGLVCITNLNPDDRSIFVRYAEIVKYMMSLSLEKMTLQNYISLINLESTSVIDSAEKIGLRFFL
jgi:hypothetical protein